MSHTHSAVSSRAPEDVPTAVASHPGWETLLVTGPDRCAWLSGVLTCDTRALRAGDAVWGLALDRKGKIQGEVWVLATPDSLLCAVSAGRAAPLFEHLDAMLIMEDAELAIDSRWSWFECIGAGAVNQAAALAAAGGYSGALSRGPLTVGLVCVPRARVEETLAALPPSAILSDDEWQRVRWRAGLTEFGTDFGPEARPHDAALERLAISWSKGCYLGQEVVCMQDMRGKVQKRLMPMKASVVPQTGDTVVDADGKEVGVVRSAVPEQDGTTCALLMVMLRTTYREPLTLSSGGGLTFAPGQPG